MQLLKMIFLLVTVAFCSGAYAQKTKTVKIQTFKKYKVPKLTTSIGNYKDTMFISVQTADSLIGIPFQITDAKKNPYTISSYQFLYRKNVATEDEQTGKVSRTTSIKSSLFKTTPLPAIWVNTLREDLRPGEEILFFDVIAKDAQGRVMYAPNLKFILR